MSAPSLTAADLARLRRAAHLVDMHDREGAKALAADWPLVETVPELGAWLDATRTDELPANPEHELLCILRGWRRYYQAAYSEAAAEFAAALRAGTAWSSWAELGLGKVCSDLGHWPRARSWLASALTTARRANDQARMAECVGALGELFLRAGQPREALELFELDMALLEPGSGHRLRLQNYRAVALGRLGRTNLAIPMLWEAAFTALPRDPLSACYSLGSLTACAMRDGDRALHERVVRLRREQADRLDPIAVHARLPEAVGLLCTAVWQWGPDSAPGPEARALLSAAVRCLGQMYPFECVWIDALASGEPNACTAGWEALAARASGPSPGERPVGVVDAWVTEVPLARSDLLTAARDVLMRETGAAAVRAGLELWFI